MRQKCTSKEINQLQTTPEKPFQSTEEAKRKLLEKSNYISPIDLQTKHFKTVCDLLGEAQVVMQQISTKLKKIPNPENICKCDKSMQLEFLELSRDKQLFKINLPLAENLDQNNIGIQVDIPKDRKCNLQTCIDTTATIVEITDGKSEIQESLLLETNKENVEPNINQQSEATYLHESNEKEINEIEQEISKPDILKNKQDVILNIENKSDISNADDVQVETQTATVVDTMNMKIDDLNEIKTDNPKEIEGETKEMLIENTNINSENYEILSKQDDDEDDEKKQNNEMSKYVKPDDFVDVDVSMRIQSKKINISTRNKLSIQMMPHIDIQRGLVVQKIPMVVINSNESLPHLDSPEDSNIKYEIVKHHSNNNILTENKERIETETNKENDQTRKAQNQEGNIAESIKNNNLEERVLKQTEETAIQTENNSSNISTSTSIDMNTLMGLKSNTTFIEKETVNTLLIPIDNSKVFNDKVVVNKEDIANSLSLNKYKSSNTSNKNKNEQEKSDIEACKRILSSVIASTDQKPVLESDEKDFISKKKPISEKTSIKTNLNIGTRPDLPVQTYINQAFDSQTESEQLLELKKASEEELLSIDGSTSPYCLTPPLEPRRSNLTGLLNDQNYIKEYLNEIIKDPGAEVLLKSYQIIEDRTRHEPEVEVDVSQLTFIDKEVYQTFVNPKGFKVADNSISETKRLYKNLPLLKKSSYKLSECQAAEDNADSNANGIQETQTQQSELVEMPSSFYSSKSVQCNDSVQGSVNKTDQKKLVVLEDNKLEATKKETEDIQSKNQNKSTICKNEGSNVSEDSFTSSANNNLSDIDCVWKNNETNAPSISKSQTSISKSQTNLYVGIQDIENDKSNSLHNFSDRKKKNSRILTDLLQTPSPASHVMDVAPSPARTKSSVVNISHDIPKKLSAAINISRNSVSRRASHPSNANVHPDNFATKAKRSIDNTLKKITSPPLLLLPAPPVTKESKPIRASSKISLKSEDTEDIIFEIDRQNLRRSQQQSKMEFDDESTLGATRKRAGSVKKESISSYKTITDSDTSEYVITHDVSLQTSLVNSSDIITDLFKHSRQSIDAGVASLKDIVHKDINKQDEHITCCGNLCRHTRKGNTQEAYVKSSLEPSAPKKSSLAHSSHSMVDLNKEEEDGFYTSSRKSVKIEEPMYIPTPITLSLPQRVLRRLSRRGITPVGSFITGLTSFNKEDIAIARNNPPKNALSVFEQYTSEEIVHTIRSASDAAYSHLHHTETADAVCQTSIASFSDNINIEVDTISQLDEHNSKIVDNITEDNNYTDKNNDVTVMAVSVRYPENAINEKFLKPVSPENITSYNRNVPGGDDTNYPINSEIPSNSSNNNNHHFYSDYQKHEGIVHHPRKYKSFKKKGHEISLSDTTTSESISEKTEEVLSDGEVKCKCTASIGEMHMCPNRKKLRSAQYLKRHPQNLINYEFGDPNLKIKRQREFNSNWVAYYVSRSPSPELDNSESFSSPTDSSGLIKRFN